MRKTPIAFVLYLRHTLAANIIIDPSVLIERNAPLVGGLHLKMDSRTGDPKQSGKPKA